ncbi:MAG: c-type cytochrome [Saprospiraceae bacterium]|nr:c-type cytochrome [Saprospiraceae bacterium]
MKSVLILFPLAILLAAFSPKADPEIPADIKTLLDKNGCVACHHMSRKLVGPSWMDISKKKYTAKRIAQLVAKPEPQNWPGYVPMLAQPTVPKAEMTKIANWLSKLK